jgi:hypothetical protein
MMTTLRTKRMLLPALVLALPLLAINTIHADTVDIVHDGYGAHDTMTFWGAGYEGAEVYAGVYLLDKTASTGIGDTWSNGPIAGFCIELHEPAPNYTYTYDVAMPDDVYNSYIDEVIGTTKANYLRELWARYYDDTWASGGSYTAQQNAAAEAFAAAVWEIVYEDLPGSPADWDVTVDGTLGVGGFAATDLDAATANKWLHELTGTGYKADLLAFVYDGQQNYLVAVPEPATILLLGLGGMLGLAGRKKTAA